MRILKNNNYDFMARRKTFWLISLVIFAVGIIFNIIFGTQLDIRFTGGAIYKYAYSTGVSATDAVTPTDASNVVTPSETPSGVSAPVRGEAEGGENVPLVAPASGTDVFTTTAAVVSGSEVSATDATGPVNIDDIEMVVDESFNVDSDEAARIITAALGRRVEVVVANSSADVDSGIKIMTVTMADNDSENSSVADNVIRAVMLRKYPNVDLELRESNSVNPTMGKEFFWKCMVAIALASVFMVLYVGFRFRKIGGWTAGASSIVAILHDCLVVYFTFVIFRFPLDDNFIAVVLAMIGYSLNSTIVIFDRTRENRKLLSPKTPVAELANISMNETLGRTINTNLCVFAAVATVAVVAIIFGLDSIISFAVPMMFGTVSGCYSSLCISNSVWVTWQEALEKRAGKKA